MADRETAIQIFCDFCKKERIQVGQLSCKHRMCANCYPFHAMKMDKCSICVLAAAEVKRATMKIIKSFDSEGTVALATEQKLFCSNEYCAFVGTAKELLYHKLACDLNDQQKESSEPVDFGSPETRSSVKASVFLKILKDTLTAPSKHGNSLTSEKVRSLTLEAWDQAELRLLERLDDGSVPDHESKTEELKPLNLDVGNHESEKAVSNTDTEVKGNPKFSVEISDFVDLKLSSPEVPDSWDSNDSTSEIASTGSDSSYVLTGSVDWSIRGKENLSRSLSQSIEEPKDRRAEFQELTEDERDPPARHDAVGKMSDRSNVSKRSLVESSGIDPDCERREIMTEQSSLPNRASEIQNVPSDRRPDSSSLILWTSVLVALISALYLMRSPTTLPDPGVSENRPEFKQPGDSDGYVTWRVNNVSDLVARARFNERDMRMSELIAVRNYKVRLGVGYTYSPKYRVVILWISAFVMKDSARLWPREEIMQLRLEHNDKLSVQSYSFKANHEGKWDEKQRIGRNKLLYCQMEIETTKRLKYMRFTSFMSYEEAVAEGYIENDSIVAGFKLLPWDNVSPPKSETPKRRKRRSQSNIQAVPETDYHSYSCSCGSRSTRYTIDSGDKARACDCVTKFPKSFPF